MEEEVIYLINLDWGWIKQRPHFIVKEIGERFNVRVLYQRRYRRGSLQNNNENTIKLYNMYKSQVILYNMHKKEHTFNVKCQ